MLEDARVGVLICDRCYGRLYRRLESAPPLVEHLRALTRTISAKRYSLTAGRGSPDHQDVVNPNLLDALRDVMSTIYAGELPSTATPKDALEQARGGVSQILDGFDSLANDADAISEWWQIVMSAQIPDAPDFWTITRALARWPLDDRRRWAREPCPKCDLLTVTISPPSRPGGPTWFVCRTCEWQRTDRDDDGLWGQAIGPYSEQGIRVDQEGSS